MTRHTAHPAQRHSPLRLPLKSGQNVDAEIAAHACMPSTMADVEGVYQVGIDAVNTLGLAVSLHSILIPNLGADDASRIGWSSIASWKAEF